MSLKIGTVVENPGQNLTLLEECHQSQLYRRKLSYGHPGQHDVEVASFASVFVAHGLMLGISTTWHTLLEISITHLLLVDCGEKLRLLYQSHQQER